VLQFNVPGANRATAAHGKMPGVKVLLGLLMLVGGGVMFWRGVTALVTGEIDGRFGVTYTGSTAMWLGIMMVIVGPLLAAVGAMRAFR